MGVYDQIRKAFQDIVAPEVHALRGEIRVVDQKVAALDEQIDGVDQRLTQKVDAVDARLGAKIDGVDQELTEKIDGLDQKLTHKSTPGTPGSAPRSTVWTSSSTRFGRRPSR